MKNSRWMACLALFSASCLLAQVSAVISGTVTDQLGAVVPDATVTSTNTETGAVRETTADGGGHYQISSLPVGPYEVRVKKPGFQQAFRQGIQLLVNQSATVDFTLQVGGAEQICC
jgi:hypothetical protein